MRPISKLKSWTVLDRVGAAPVAVDEWPKSTCRGRPAGSPAKTPRKPRKSKAKSAPEAAEA